MGAFAHEILMNQPNTLIRMLEQNSQNNQKQSDSHTVIPFNFLSLHMLDWKSQAQSMLKLHCQAYLGDSKTVSFSFKLHQN